MNINKIRTVVILAAGLGSRMKSINDKIHKCLLPIENKAIVSKIIDKFPKNTKFIIAVGHKKRQIINFCKIVHKDLNIKFLNIKNYSSTNSGPGHSLLQSKKIVKSPFYFTTSDTLFENIKFDKIYFKNWVAVSKNIINSNESIKYCCFRLKKNKVFELFDKVKNVKKSYSFSGLAKITDTKNFFDNLKNKFLINNEHQISNGFKKLINNNLLYAYKTEWTDLGSEVNYKNKIIKKDYFDFSKRNEFVYLYKNNIVAKFFSNPSNTKKRYERSILLKNVIPEIIKYDDNFLYYKWFNGKTLYEKCNKKIFLKLLSFLKKNIWIIKRKKDFKHDCIKFYKYKTYSRIKDFRIKYPNFKNNLFINKTKIPNLELLLKKIDWSKLSQGIPVNFHGDLQFDNILYDGKKFKLIDWRDSFGDAQEGDLYYDFAKLLGGIEINYKLIKKNKFYYNEKNNHCYYSLPKYKNQKNYRRILEEFVIKNNYCLKKVELIKALIFINMAPLHNYPFDKLLYAHSLLSLDKYHKSNI